MKAYIFINVQISSADAIVLNMLSGIKEITEVNRVFGQWDIIVKAEADNEIELGKILDKIRGLNCVKETLTLVVEH